MTPAITQQLIAGPVMHEDLRVGAIVRARRRRLGLRQQDVAGVAGVSRQCVSLLECGGLMRLGVRSVRDIAAAVGIDLTFAVRSKGASVDRLIDERHSALVDAVVGRLESAGWAVTVEFSFNHYGDRGSVDVLAWRADRGALLLIEVKSEVADLQALCRSVDVKERILPGVVARERGWRPGSVGVVVVLPDDPGQRKAVGRRSAIFATSFPARTLEIRHWIVDPVPGRLRGIWFLASANGIGITRHVAARKRVQGSRPAGPDRPASVAARPASVAEVAKLPVRGLARPPRVHDGR
jgi:transcriptional regulator with XRE-family HTH domain